MKVDNNCGTDSQPNACGNAPRTELRSLRQAPRIHQYDDTESASHSTQGQTNTSTSRSVRAAPVAAPVAPAVTSPPASLHANPYYTKYVGASGIPIIANGTVSDAALLKMKSIVSAMVPQDREVRSALVKNLKAVLIIPSGKDMTTLPEYRRMDPAWNARAQGVGWTANLPYMSCSEANLLRAGEPLDRYPDQSVGIHEFAHTVFDAGIAQVDKQAKSRLDGLYASAVGNGYLGNSYAASNASEYWAEGVQAWFNAASPSNKQATTVSTNQALRANDPGLWKEISRWFPPPSSAAAHDIYP